MQIHLNKLENPGWIFLLLSKRYIYSYLQVTQKSYQSRTDNNNSRKKDKSYDRFCWTIIMFETYVQLTFIYVCHSINICPTTTTSKRTIFSLFSSIAFVFYFLGRYLKWNSIKFRWFTVFLHILYNISPALTLFGLQFIVCPAQWWRSHRVAIFTVANIAHFRFITFQIQRQNEITMKMLCCRK